MTTQGKMILVVDDDPDSLLYEQTQLVLRSERLQREIRCLLKS
jgi:hypothetical protein